MQINLETLLIALVFILPGFLTSRLLVAKIPAVEKKPTPLIETYESLLRSVYINLIISPFFICLFSFYLLLIGSFSNLTYNDVTKFVANYPILTTYLFYSWAISAFALATVFGYWFDPLDYLNNKLRKK